MERLGVGGFQSRQCQAVLIPCMTTSRLKGLSKFGYKQMCESAGTFTKILEAPTHDLLIIWVTYA